MGAGFILRLHQHGCEPGETCHTSKEQSCPTCFSRQEAPAQAAVPRRSGGCHSAEEGWLAQWWRCGWNPGVLSPNQECDLLSRNCLWGQLSLKSPGCQVEGAEHPGLHTEVQHCQC